MSGTSASSSPSTSAGDSATSDADSSGSDTTDDPTQGTIPPENTRGAFFGDNEVEAASEAVLDLVIAEDADFVVILGDYDYGNDPQGWHEQLDAHLGADFPLFAVPGNHETDEDGVPGIWEDYRDMLLDRRAAFSGYDCTGTFAEQESCIYQGIHLGLSAAGTLGDANDHAQALANTWAASDAVWRVCAWHKNQEDMNTGNKGDEVGWGAYQACQQGGAIIMSGHEHSYARTMTVTDLGGASDHGAVGDPAVGQVGPGSTFVVVSGLGGRAIRGWDSDHDDDTWWASYLNGDTHLVNGEVGDADGDYGVTFIDFHVDGDPRKARGYFKTISGEVTDEWVIYSDNVR